MPLQKIKDIFLQYGIWIIICAYVAFFSFLTGAQYVYFLFHDFDLAVHAQIIWNILQGSTFNSILGIGFLGNHANFISFILAPFYALFPTPVTLLVLQSAALGFSAYPLFLIARKFLTLRLALCVAVLYLIYPGIIYTNLFEFHPTPFATLFLGWMLYQFIQGDFRKFLFYAFLAMLCQENISLIIFMMGGLALLEKRSWKWVLYPLTAGTLYFLFCVKFLMPYFADGKVNFFSLYAHLGKDLPDVLASFVVHPVKTFSLLASPDRLIYLAMLFIPLCFVPLIGAKALLPIFPMFMQHMLSNRLMDRRLEYHYTAEMLPFIFLALIFALRILSPLRKAFNGVVVSIFLCSLLIFMRGPYQKIADTLSAIRHAYPASIKEVFIREIPPKASLVTTFDFMSKASQRERLYSFHHIYSGYYTLSRVPYPLPPSVDYALLDTMDRMTFEAFYHPQGYLNFLHFLQALDMTPVAVRDNFVLFSHGTADQVELFSSSMPAAFKEGLPLFTNGEVRLDKVEAFVDNGVLNLYFDWQALKKPEQDLNVYVDFFDHQGNLVHRLPLAVCYRIHPTQAWESGSRVIDRKYLTIPEKLKGFSFLIKIGFLDQVAKYAFKEEILISVNKGD